MDETTIEITAKPYVYRRGPGRNIVGTSYQATGPDGQIYSSASLRTLRRSLKASFPDHSVRVIDGRDGL